ncbi:hypothetical protein A1O1_00278 [Capronia coronata CBS 617.96]|uniref:Uncharacterized protein n=1 Tax=Capronia coronata CBS 617.96 TaxID=1182541 RepID=W9ZKW5_9EURO|nr:uncharacterized protein A1O1_00278 [Capronia coronata CBS 617.96]EXJ95159.1 hypothetical protein A1O1_00278 [Capronia coronata CBS 617.96]
MSQRTFVERLHDRLALNEHSRRLSQQNTPSYVHTPAGSADCSQSSFAFDSSQGAKVTSLDDIQSAQSSDWPSDEKYYSLSIDGQNLQCPTPILWKTILLPTAVIIFPMAALVAGLLALILGYRVKSDNSLFVEVSNAEALGDHAVVLVNYSATRIVFVASWASTLAPLLSGFIMSLSAFQLALAMYRSSSGTDQHALPTPYQYSLLVGLCLASTGRLRRYFSYSSSDGVIVPPILRRAARTLTLSLVLAVVVFGADTALHYTTSTINFDRISVSSDVHNYGRGLSSECLALDRSANYGLPCSRNAELAGEDYDAYVAGQNEVFFLQHGTSNESEIRLVPNPTSPKENVALLLPQSDHLSPFRDFQTQTAGVITTCAPISSECQWKSWGPSESYSQFNCSNAFWGVLGKAANITNTGALISDIDVPPLGFKPGAALQYGFYMDEDLSKPYDSQGNLGPFMTDNELINPVYLGIAGRFATTSQRAGVNMSADPGMYKGPTSTIDFVLRCEYTTYLADYSRVNSTAKINTLTKSPNGTLAEIYHGYDLVGSVNAFDNELQDMILQAALASDAGELAATFASSYSTRVMSVIGPFLSRRANVREQTRTPLLVAKVPKAPLAILAACCLAYVLFGVTAAVCAHRALSRVDVRDLASQFSLPALGLHAFRDHATDQAACEIDGAGHRLFEESNIKTETMRVAVEGGPRSGYSLKSLV